jgi:hypothetical protein
MVNRRAAAGLDSSRGYKDRIMFMRAMGVPRFIVCASIHRVRIDSSCAHRFIVCASYRLKQTERRGGAGPVRSLLGGKDLTGRWKTSLGQASSPG